MVVVINGNVATVKSDKIQYADLKKAKYASIVDAEGKILYRAFVGTDGCIEMTSIAFAFADAEGKASMNIVVEGVDTLTKEILMELVGPELVEFRNYEEALAKDIEEQLALRNDIEANISIM